MNMQTKLKASDLDDGQLIKFYVKLRDRRATRKAAYEEDDAQEGGAG